jgi:iron-sulfur cluster assembly protein
MPEPIGGDSSLPAVPRSHLRVGQPPVEIEVRGHTGTVPNRLPGPPSGQPETMLAITNDAADVIRGLMDSGAGALRIAPAAPTSNGHGPALLLELAPEPEVEDEVVDADGAQVFVDPGIVPTLEDKVLDAHVDGEQLEFAVRDRD